VFLFLQEFMQRREFFIGFVHRYRPAHIAAAAWL
jgi:hypothetical protein